MQHLEQNQYRRLLDCVIGVLGRGGEYSLALASKGALSIVAQIVSRDRKGVYLTNLLSNIGTTKVPELKSALCLIGVKASGRMAQLVLRLTASGLPPSSVWYFLSTTGLCDYAKDSLQQRGGNDPRLNQLMNKAAGRGLLPLVQMLERTHVCGRRQGAFRSTPMRRSSGSSPSRNTRSRGGTPHRAG